MILKFQANQLFVILKTVDMTLFKNHNRRLAINAWWVEKKEEKSLERRGLV